VLKFVWLILPPAQAGVQCPTDRWIYTFCYFLTLKIGVLYIGFFFYIYPDLIEVGEVMIAF
jgi:hypothetical protein